jgi:hypothetical protein
MARILAAHFSQTELDRIAAQNARHDATSDELKTVVADV